MAAFIAQADQGQAHVKPEIVIKSKTPGADGWEVKFAKDATFRDAIIFKNLEPPQQRERAFQLLGKQTKFNFRDALVKKVWSPRHGKNMDVKCSAFVSVNFDDFKVLQNSEHSESSAWIISFELNENKVFEVKIGQREPPASTLIQNDITEQNVPLWRMREEIQRMTCVMFILPNFRNCGAFKAHTAQAILQRSLEQQPWQSYEHFMELQHEALQADEKKREEELKALKRDSVNVQVVPNPNSPGTPLVSVWLPGGGGWKLEAGQDVRFESDDFKPAEAPPRNNPSDEDEGGWSMSVERQENGRFLGRFNNMISPDIFNKLTSKANFTGVQATVSEKDPEAAKLSGAIIKLGYRFKYENGVDLSDIQPGHEELLAEVKNLKLPVTRKLLEAFGEDFGTDQEDKPLEFRESGKTAFNVSDFARAGRPIEAERQLLFLSRFVEGYRGLTICQGPPGTGKTTLLANLTALLLQQCKMGTGKIVLTAHSNVAVEVLVERTANVMNRIFGKNPQNYICHIQTPSSAKRILVSGRPISPVVAALSLDHHMDRYARANPNAQWAKNYLAGKAELAQHGHIAAWGDRSEYYKSLHQMYGMMRKTFPVFACTLSTTSHEIFVGDKVQKVRPNCEILVMDEASQATIPYEVMALFNINPRRLVIAGDHKQLTPFTYSEEATKAWKRSLLQRIIERPFSKVVRLNVQYRHPAEIGNSISVVHYQGDVKPHPSCNNRPRVAEIRKAVARISFRVQDTVYHLAHNVHFFNLHHGKSIKTGEDSSSFNMEEVNFIRGLVWCLVQVGITEDSIMALTGYEAQYNELDKVRKLLPNGKMAARKIDSSQGDERDIVIVSTVKSGTELGFMKAPHRQNVGCSRARNAQFLVGNWECLRHDPNTWRPYLEQQSIDQGAMRDGWRFNLLGPVSQWLIDNKPTVPFSGPSGPSAPTPAPAPAPTPAPAPSSAPAPAPSVAPPPPPPAQTEEPAKETSLPPPTPSSVPEQAEEPSPTIVTPAPATPVSAPPPPATSRQALIAGHLREVTGLSSEVRTWALDKLQPALKALWNKEGDVTRLSWDVLALGANRPASLTIEQLSHLHEYFKLRWEVEQELKQLQALEL